MNPLSKFNLWPWRFEREPEGGRVRRVLARLAGTRPTGIG